jgi:predicted kinase
MTILVVSGPPGSGKSTLSSELARTLAWPLVSRDGIKEKLVADVPDYVPEPGDDVTWRTFEIFSAVLRILADANVSCVAEAAFQHERWSDVLTPLLGSVDVRLVRLRAPAERTPEPGRFEEPTFDVPTLDVDTRSGYDPPLDEIVTFALR